MSASHAAGLVRLAGLDHHDAATVRRAATEPAFRDDLRRRALRRIKASQRELVTAVLGLRGQS
jgi:hypothetical protein